jgi:voltage-gated potassium channel
LESRIKTLDNHVIVCGFGRMGQMVVQHLRDTKVQVVVIEVDNVRTRKLDEMGLLYLVGDATDEDVLHRAGIERARALVAVLPGDADNVFVTLTARELRSDLHIVARAEQFTAMPKLRRAGATRVISPQAIGAERIANIITRPHVVDFVEVAAKGVDLELDEFVVGQDSPLAGKSLRDADIRKAADVMVVAIKRADGSTRFSPGADVIIQPQDTLIMIGPSGASGKLEEMRVGGEAT